MPAKVSSDLALILIYPPKPSNEEITVLLVRPSKLIRAALNIKSVGSPKGFYEELQKSNFEDWLVGFIGLARVNKYSCGPVFDINGSAAQRGYGPLIYDLALSAAYYTPDILGLIPDRDSVSDDATSIWNFYYDRRSDVETIPIRGSNCPLYGEDSLDSIYSIDTPTPYYSNLLARGDELIETLKKMTKFDDEEIEKIFFDITFDFFYKKYNVKNPKPKPKNTKLYNQVKKEAMDRFEVYPSIYANSWVVKEYKKRGGTYSGDPEEGGLTKWYGEKWVNVCERGPVSGFKSCGRPTVDGLAMGKYPACRPLKKAKKLSKKQIKSMCKKKRTKVTKAKKKTPSRKSPVYVSWPK